MNAKIPFMILPERLSSGLAKYILGIGKRIEIFLPGLQYDIRNARLDKRPIEYIAQSLINCVFVSLGLGLLVFCLKHFINNDPLQSTLLISSGIFVLSFILYISILLRYPKILAAKRAEQVDKNLLFAVKDLMLQVSSGISLYDAFVNVSKGEYGAVSVECGVLVGRVKTGMSMEDGLEKMGLETRSEFLRRTALQLLNTLKSGGSVKGALHTIIDELVSVQQSKIENYAKELNLWTLVYMLFAVAIPSIGSTMLILLASFAGLGATEGTFVVFIVVMILIQVALIGFIKTKRPVVNV